MTDPEILEQVQEDVAATEKPIVINPSTIQAQAASISAHLVVIIAAFTAISGFVGKRDLMGFINYIQSAEALPFLALVVGGGTVVWRQIKARKTVQKQVTLAMSVPDHIAKVKGL